MSQVPSVSAPTAATAASPDRARQRDLALRLLHGAMAHGSPGHARLLHPDPTGPLGADIDGLEGFARSFELLGILVEGEGGDGFAAELDWYAEGIVAGTDPTGPERWPGLDHGQAKVEAASLALALDQTRPWLWDRLSARERGHVIDYLAPAVGDETYPRINWVWFRLMTQTFLRSVGGPFALDEMRADLATHDSFLRPGSWLADGAERSYDHYSAWALQTFPVLWSRMRGAEDLAAERGTVDRDRLDAFLGDWLHLVGGDGSPLRQGRSLTYRFAAAAPFWAGALAGTGHDPALLRRAASLITGHFESRGVPDERDLLTIGWTRPWRALAQDYTGPGSPYWAAKGLLGLALPAEHPAWTAPEPALPVEAGDRLRMLRAPGWLVSSTASDGIVRVINHGTDHSTPGEAGGDSPLYARLGYSTATFPLLDAESWWEPLDQSVTVLDAAGAATHRSGFVPVAIAPADGCLVGASDATMHWMAERTPQWADGAGVRAPADDAARVRVLSAVRGAWEVRLVRVTDVIEPERCRTLRVGGWAVDGDRAPEEAIAPGAASATAGDLVSAVIADAGARPAVVRRSDASPTGASSAVPVVELPLVVGRWQAVAVGLGRGLDAAAAPRIVLSDAVATVTWPDGPVSRIVLDPLTTAPRPKDHR